MIYHDMHGRLVSATPNGTAWDVTFRVGSLPAGLKNLAKEQDEKGASLAIEVRASKTPIEWCAI